MKTVHLTLLVALFAASALCSGCGQKAPVFPKVQAKQLAKEFATDTDAAAKKYDGQVFVIEGTLKEDPSDQVTIGIGYQAALEGHPVAEGQDTRYESVLCFLDPDEKD